MEMKSLEKRIEDIEKKTAKMPDKKLYYAILVLSVINLILTVRQQM